jgi:hypothetical protein
MAQLITANNINPTTLNVITGPRVSAIQYPGDDTAAAVEGGQIITLTGAGFQTGAAVYIDNVVVGVTTVISGTTLSFVSPAKAAGGYPLYVVNSDGGIATFLAGIQYSGVPIWTTSAGSLGTLYETEPFNYSLSANSDSSVTYSVTAGTLAAGATLNATTGNITGTASTVESSTTYNFTVDAIDQEQQNTSRNFSITVNPDTVTWLTPSIEQLYTYTTTDSVNISLSASNLIGGNIVYTSGNLPTGLSIVSNSVTGMIAESGSYTTTIRATSQLSSKFSEVTVSFSATSAAFTVEYLIAAGGGGSSDFRGGGGGGGLILGNTSILPGTTVTVTVGSGGTKTSFGYGTKGGNTTVSGLLPSVLTALGGGAGGYNNISSGAISSQLSGGSGGGGSNTNNGSITTAGSGLQPSSASGGFGNSGSNGTSGRFGGGGGAGAAGGVGGVRVGGNGIASSITGSLVYYCGGGYGWDENVSADYSKVGLGGGSSNFGGGAPGGPGGPGGPGVVIFSYISPTQKSSGGTVTSYSLNGSTYWVHRFTSAGTFTA